MPVEVAIWNVSNSTIEKIPYSPITSERRLEDILSADISILGDDYLPLGRQIRTPHGKFVDLLAIDAEGNLTIIELKKSRTPRDVVAQTLDYASWVQSLSYQDIIDLFEDHNPGQTFEPAFEEKFGEAPPEALNEQHDMLIVCSELDHETERIITYLSDNYDVPVNAVFFRFFKDNSSEYLSRSWLIDPHEVEEKGPPKGRKIKVEPWNGRDFVANVDIDRRGISSWDDAVKYGFVSAGGGKWYSRTLGALFPGARVFAMIPKQGYVGVGKVIGPRTPITEFSVTHDGREIPILDAPLKSDLKGEAGNPDLQEYFVPVEWEKTVPIEKAYWEKGMRANQNSAYKLKNKFTLDKLIEFFGLEE